MIYHARGSAAVPPRKNTGDFAANLATLARRLLFSAVGLTTSERDRLEDIERGRFPMKTLQELIAIARRSVRPEDREALAEIIRAELLAEVPAVLDIRVAGDLEMQAEAAHNVAWRAFELAPSRITRERAIETGTAHRFGLQAQIDVLLVHRC